MQVQAAGMLASQKHSPEDRELGLLRDYVHDLNDQLATLRLEAYRQRKQQEFTQTAEGSEKDAKKTENQAGENTSGKSTEDRCGKCVVNKQRLRQATRALQVLIKEKEALIELSNMLKSDLARAQSHS